MKENNLLTILNHRRTESSDKIKQLQFEINLCDRLGFTHQKQVLKEEQKLMEKFDFILTDILVEFNQYLDEPEKHGNTDNSSST